MSFLQSRDLKNGRQIIPLGVKTGAEVCVIPREVRGWGGSRPQRAFRAPEKRVV